MPQFPYIFTFYSFKGGVGRSLALLNVAYLLAQRGRHVLVVDMDLEAPGVSGFLQRQQELASPDAARPLDVLDLLAEAVTAAKSGATPKDAVRSLPPVSNYQRKVRADKLAALRPRIGQLGRLDVIAADLDRDYWHRLPEVGIQGLPQDRLIVLSELLHHYFKAQRFPHRPLGLEDFEPPIQTPYDYVLIDSRTGITEVGGLCVGPLADRLVVLTGLNDQNVQGTLSFMQEAGIKPQARTPQDELWDEADVRSEGAEAHPSLGPKPTVLVASPVPHGEVTFKRQRLKELEKQLGLRPLALSYHPQMALLEAVFVRDFREEFLAAQYAMLADVIMARVSDHPTQLAARAGAMWSQEQQQAGAIQCVVRLTPHQPELGLPLLMQMANALKSKTEQDSWAERQLLGLLSQDPPAKAVAFLNWGTVLLSQAKTKRGGEADQLLGAAEQKFAVALKLKPDSYEALNNWGTALLARGRIKQDEEADKCFAAAGQKYAEAIELKPDHSESYCNWGAVLGEQAEKTGETADGILELAGQKFAKALELKPGDCVVLDNWGRALLRQSNWKSGPAQAELRQAAKERLLAAHQIRAGSSAYNLACLEALEGSVTEALRWLQLGIANGQRFSQKQIGEETDFDSARHEPVFQEFLSSLPPE